ncbi:Ceramide kinase-like protein [Liparis tanakae]|uniref:Ceramide kinase-like protein n=1 Tax=Liparis tanakae TaxID=230148 RepID=A0A4Z2EAP4_9TELE|nr:Ceramide kinase-like protein [Liparis tanakae]
MCSFSSLGQLVCFGFSAMFGFGGRSLARAEKKRWMPSSRRREYALAKTLARLRPEDCQLSFLPAKKSSGDRDEDPESEGEEFWTSSQGLYLSISIMSIPCLSPHTPRGLAPNTSLADGSAALIAVGNTSRSEFIKHLKRYGGSSGQVRAAGRRPPGRYLQNNEGNLQCWGRSSNSSVASAHGNKLRMNVQIIFRFFNI